MIEALRHSFGELKLPSSQTLLTRNVPIGHGDSLFIIGQTGVFALVFEGCF